MHLAIVSPFPPAVTGIGQYGYHVSRTIAESGLFERVTILAGKTEGAPLLKARSPLVVDYAWRPESLDMALVILSRLRSLNPDLVWFNLGASIFGRSPLANLSGLMSPGLSCRMGFPTIVTLHELVELADLRTLNAPGGPLARFGARLLTGIAAQADVICLTMRRYADWFALRRPGLRCVHIPIGAYYSPEMLSERNTPELLIFTTLAPFKGLELLVETYRSLLPVYPGIRLTVAGAEHTRFPGYTDHLRRKYASLPGIRWLGEVKEEGIRELFGRAQVVVLPYTASTGSSSVLYQAAMWGRPIVASDLSEIRTTAAESGLEIEFFKNGDAAELAGAIRSLLDAPDRRRAQAGHNFTVIQRSRPEETCRLYLQAFNLTLETHDSPKRLNIPAGISLESV